MSRGLSMAEMLHCTDMTVLERQRARMKWQQQQQEEESYFSELSGVFSFPGQQVAAPGGFDGGFMGGGVMEAVKPDPGLDNGWVDPCGFGFGPCGPGLEANHGISRTYSCPPLVVAEGAAGKSKEAAVLNEKLKLINSAAGKESFKKRKTEKIQNTKVTVTEDETKNKRMKASIEEGDSNSKITYQNNNNNNKSNKKEASGDSSKDNSKVSEVQKPDYIHVRARRGQATDSHSLAERVRREKISERMKYLQDLVPGCNKITGKAGMLDEIINYVQSLQRQVEFLSMKLAAVNPRLDFNMDDFFPKEMFNSCPVNFPTIISGMSSSEMMNPVNYLQFNNMQQVIPACSGLEMGIINPPDHMGLRRTISAPVSLPETFVDSSCFTTSTPTWDADLQNYYNNMASFDHGRLTPTTTTTTSNFTSQQPFTGSIEVGNLKMEM